MAAVYPFLEQLHPLEVPLSLYIHIPFCSRKCGYCDFYSRPGIPAEQRLPVIRRIAKEVGGFCDALDPPSIASVFIGGGTPNSLSPEELELLFSSLEDQLAARGRGGDRREIGRSGKGCLGGTAGGDFEWTVEVNPELLTFEQLELMDRYGVNRVSMGIQSFAPDALELLGRSAGADAVYRALELLAGAWTGEVNLDMMTALPGRSTEEEGADIRTALSFEPDHLSVYALTVEEGTALAAAREAGRLEPVPEETAVSALSETVRSCTQAGYRHYEVSNFARPGRESLHNLRYWRMEPYLGVGPAAVSTVPVRGGVLRATGRRQQEGYETDYIGAEDFLLEHLMMGLRTAEGVSFSRLARIFGLNPARLVPRSLEHWRDAGLLFFDRSRLYPSEAGMLMLDHILVDMSMELDEHREALQSAELNWPLPPE